MSVIAAQGLRKKFGNVHALDEAKPPRLNLFWVWLPWMRGTSTYCLFSPSHNAPR